MVNQFLDEDPNLLVPPEILELRMECGCEKCTCEAGTNYKDLYLTTHTFGLFEQEGDPLNMLESGAYDEQDGPQIKRRD